MLTLSQGVLPGRSGGWGWDPMRHGRGVQGLRRGQSLREAEAELRRDQELQKESQARRQAAERGGGGWQERWPAVHTISEWKS